MRAFGPRAKGNYNISPPLGGVCMGIMVFLEIIPIDPHGNIVSIVQCDKSDINVPLMAAAALL